MTKHSKKMNDTIFLKIELPKYNEETERIREAGMFFEAIAEALYLEREDIVEIDESNYKIICNEIKQKFE